MKRDNKKKLDIDKMGIFGNEYRDCFCSDCLERMKKKSSKFRNKLSKGKQPSIIQMIAMQKIKICNSCRQKVYAKARRKSKGGFRQ